MIRLIATIVILLLPSYALAQTNPGFVEGAVLCADNTDPQCPTPDNVQPGLNQAFMGKADVAALALLVLLARQGLLVGLQGHRDPKAQQGQQVL